MPRVASLSELNALVAAADDVDDARHIAGRRATVGSAAAAERPFLRRLPGEPFDATLTLSAKVDRKACTAVRGSHYSVPARLAGRRVEVRLGGRTICVRDGGRIMAVHPRSLRKGA